MRWHIACMQDLYNPTATVKQCTDSTLLNSTQLVLRAACSWFTLTEHRNSFFCTTCKNQDVNREFYAESSLSIGQKSVMNDKQYRTSLPPKTPAPTLINYASMLKTLSCQCHIHKDGFRGAPVLPEQSLLAPSLAGAAQRLGPRIIMSHIKD